RPAHRSGALAGRAGGARRGREPVTAHRHGPPTTISVLKAPATASPVAPITAFRWRLAQRGPLRHVCAALPTRVASIACGERRHPEPLAIGSPTPVPPPELALPHRVGGGPSRTGLLAHFVVISS